MKYLSAFIVPVLTSSGVEQLKFAVHKTASMRCVKLLCSLFLCHHYVMFVSVINIGGLWIIFGIVEA